MNDLKFAIEQLDETIKELEMPRPDYAKKVECEVGEAETIRKQVTIKILKSVKNRLEMATKEPAEVKI